jgi:hypothetical protein
VAVGSFIVLDLGLIHTMRTPLPLYFSWFSPLCSVCVCVRVCFPFNSYLPLFVVQHYASSFSFLFCVSLLSLALLCITIPHKLSRLLSLHVHDMSISLV